MSDPAQPGEVGAAAAASPLERLGEAAKAFAADRPEAGEAFVTALTLYCAPEPAPPLDPVADLLCGADSTALLEFASWDVVGFVYEALVALPPGSVKGGAAGRLLARVAEACSPRDVLIPLSQWVGRAPLRAWRHLVPALCRVLSRLEGEPLRQAKSFRSTFSVAAGILARARPEDAGGLGLGGADAEAAEDAESRDGDGDDEERAEQGGWTPGRLAAVLEQLLAFGAPLLAEWRRRSGEPQERQDAVTCEILRQSLVRFHMLLLSHRTLAFGDPEGALQAAVATVAGNLAALNADAAAIFSQPLRRARSRWARHAAALALPDSDSEDSDSSDDDDVELDDAGCVRDPRYNILNVATFAVVAMSDATWAESLGLPAAFSPKFILRCGDVLCKTLLVVDNTQIKHQGMRLLHALLRRISRQSLSKSCLDEWYLEGASEDPPTFQRLIEFTVLCDVAEIRQEGVGVLREFFGRFAAEGRHALYATMLQGCPFPQVGYLLLLWIKNDVIQAIKEQDSDARQWFTGPLLFRLVGLAMGLQGDASFAARDIDAEHDQIAAAVNFVHFCLLQGGPKRADSVRTNDTGIWNKQILDDMEQRFLDPLERRMGELLQQYAAEKAKLGPMPEEPACCGGHEHGGQGHGHGGQGQGHGHGHGGQAAASQPVARQRGGFVHVGMDMAAAAAGAASAMSLNSKGGKLSLLMYTLSCVRAVLAEGREEMA